MNEFTDRELQLLLNSAHERGMRLFDLYGAMHQKTFRGPSGQIPTKEDRDGVLNGYKEHIKLVEKIRKMRNAT